MLKNFLSFATWNALSLEFYHFLQNLTIHECLPDEPPLWWEGVEIILTSVDAMIKKKIYRKLCGRDIVGTQKCNVFIIF